MPVIRLFFALFLFGALQARADSLMTMGMSGAASGGAPPVVAPVWDTAFNATDVSGSTINHNNGNGNEIGWLTTTSHSTGKWVFRITWTTSSGAGAIGLVPGGPTGFKAANDLASNYIAYTPDGNVWLLNFAACTGSPVAVLTAGQPVDISIDFAAGLLGIRVGGTAANWNNNASANPSTGVGMFDLTCQGTATAPPPPYFIGFSTASFFANDTVTAAVVPDAGTGKLANFTSW